MHGLSVWAKIDEGYLSKKSVRINMTQLLFDVGGRVCYVDILVVFKIKIVRRLHNKVADGPISSYCASGT